MEYDIAIIGAGTGGYVAAIRAAQLGAKVLLIEKKDLGGVCLNQGCIPTKTLLKSAEKWTDLKKIEEFGLVVSESAYDWQKIMERKNKVIHTLRSGIEKLIKAHKIDLVFGKATLKDQHTLHVVTDQAEQECDYTARKIILATGSVPAKPPLVGSDLAGVLTSDDILRINEVPASLLIIGAGAVGVEFAGIYAAFGCAVTLVEMAPTILPLCDGDLQKRMALALRKQGIKQFSKALVQEIIQNGDSLDVVIEVKGQRQVITVEKVLVATGRRPVVAVDELAAIGVEYTKCGITVNEKMETSVQGIYAIGDVTGINMLAHTASHQGLVAAANACGVEERMDYSAIAGCIFTTPEIAWVGLTEEECQASGRSIQIGKFNFAANGKALSMGETEGLAKIIADSVTHKVLGCHIMGPHASDLIMEGVLAVRLGLTAEDLAATIHPHPTLTETMGEAAQGVFGEMIHQVTLKK